jgi:ABC-2 type transport system ATP-binding protein
MLESRNVSKSFYGKTVLNGVTFTLEPGKIYALLGPNGSGKTTWMKLAASLMKPSTGEILYNGESVGVQTRADIAYMSTEPFFYSWMTIADVGKYYADFFDDFDPDRFRTLLSKMELPQNLKVRTLSSGMAAKLKIAATMARKAKIYLLDEPFNGIDLIARDQITESIITSLSPEVTLVLSSHLVEELESIVDTSIFIKDGNIVSICDIEDLRTTEGKSLAEKYREIYFANGGNEK